MPTDVTTVKAQNLKIFREKDAVESMDGSLTLAGYGIINGYGLRGSIFLFVRAKKYGLYDGVWITRVMG